MKRLALAITLASLAALAPAGAAAPRRTRACPTLTVSCPDALVRVGVPVTFTLAVNQAPADAKLTYNWIVSAGTINGGQGTNSATVDTTGLPHTTYLTATVDVAGLPEGCAGSASCTTTVYRIGDPRKSDEYGNLRRGDERARLDNFGVELGGDPEAVGYIVGYGGRRSRRGEAARRIERAKRYLMEVRGIPAGRLVTIDGGYREELTVELWALPKGATPPYPAPTVDPSEVIFIKPAPKRRSRR